MNQHIIVYLLFAIILVAGISLDITCICKKNEIISFKNALIQSIIWISIGLGFGFFILKIEDATIAVEYWTAYITEWSLSLDNIFVFVLLFKSFKLKKELEGRAIFFGVLLAIVLRVLLIFGGISLVLKHEWVLYLFALFLFYSGAKILITKNKEEPDFKKSFFAKILYKIFLIHPTYEGNKIMIIEKKKTYFTSFFLIIVMLMFVDIMFAVDSIPVTLAITQHPMSVYLSNVFAVLCMRSLFFILNTAIEKFIFLPYAIACILIFVSIKLFLPLIDIHLATTISLLVIISSILFSILLSLLYNSKYKKHESKA